MITEINRDYGDIYVIDFNLRNPYHLRTRLV